MRGGRHEEGETEKRERGRESERERAGKGGWKGRRRKEEKKGGEGRCARARGRPERERVGKRNRLGETNPEEESENGGTKHGDVERESGGAMEKLKEGRERGREERGWGWVENLERTVISFSSFFLFPSRVFRSSPPQSRLDDEVELTFFGPRSIVVSLVLSGARSSLPALRPSPPFLPDRP